MKTIYYPRFADLNISLLQEEATEIESIDFVGCYTTWLKDDIYGVTNIIVEISIILNIYTQKFGLIIEMANSNI